MIELLQRRLASYRSVDALAEEQALKEILQHLGNALEQNGPWAGQQIHPASEWLKQAMAHKIESIDWAQAASDVEPFVNEQERHGLKLWGRELFLDRLDKLQSGF